VNASASYEKPDYFLSEERQLFPEVAMTARQKDLPFTGNARRCYEQWIADVQCFSNRPQYPAFANLFLYNALNLDDVLGRHVDDSSRTYPAPGLNYATTDDLAAGFLGYADDNWVDGTQSFVFSFVSQGVIDAGYGLTTTQIHEFGHHFGMSHPHDGFDPETGIDYEPTGPFFLAWAGDESNSMMSYIDLNWDFSQFDRDNAARHQAAGYIVNANVIAGRILRSRNAGRAAQDLASADARVGQGGHGGARLQRRLAGRPLGLRVGAARGRTGRRQGDREPQRLGGTAEGEAQGPAKPEQRRDLRRLRPVRPRHQARPALGAS
jgi:hypothetical protein